MEVMAAAVEVEVAVVLCGGGAATNTLDERCL